MSFYISPFILPILLNNINSKSDRTYLFCLNNKAKQVKYIMVLVFQDIWCRSLAGATLFKRLAMASLHWQTLLHII